MSHTNLLSRRKTCRTWLDYNQFPSEERRVSCCPFLSPKGPWRSKVANEELQVWNWWGCTKVHNNQPRWNIKESPKKIECCRKHRKKKQESVKPKMKVTATKCWSYTCRKSNLMCTAFFPQYEKNSTANDAVGYEARLFIKSANKKCTMDQCLSQLVALKRLQNCLGG